MSLECHAPADYGMVDTHSPVSSVSTYRYEIEPTNKNKVVFFPDRFDEMKAKWYRETAFSSSPDEMRNTDSYKEIVSYGRIALPYIIKEIQDNPSLLMMAAHDITGENPITESIRGDMRAMMGAWVGWFQKSKQDWL
jgi:hypothetical protein